MNHLYALIVALCPVNTELPPPDDDALRDIGEFLQVLDTRERRYWDASNINELRQRWRNVSDGPPLEYGAWLPQRDIIWAASSYNRALHRTAASRAQWDSGFEKYWESYAAECEWLYRWWSNANIGTDDSCFVYARRIALKELRDDFPWCWQTRFVPPCYPSWRYDDLR